MTCKLEEKVAAEVKFGAMVDAVIFTMTMSGLYEHFNRFAKRLRTRTEAAKSGDEMADLVRREDLPDLENLMLSLDSARESLAKTITAVRAKR